MDLTAAQIDLILKLGMTGLLIAILIGGTSRYKLWVWGWQYEERKHDADGDRTTMEQRHAGELTQLRADARDELARLVILHKAELDRYDAEVKDWKYIAARALGAADRSATAATRVADAIIPPPHPGKE